MVPRVSNEQLSFARRLRADMTAAEAVLWRSLRNCGLNAKFRRQVPIGPHIADFACVAAKLVVEFDRQPPEGLERKARDALRDAWLAEDGWRVLRIPNDIVIGGGNIVLDRVKAALMPRFPSSDPASPGHLLPQSGRRENATRTDR